MSSFKDLRIVDNFYQTSSYFPMPTVMISTLAEDGSTSVGSYSLCFPYYIAGKGYYAMILEARNSSNNAQHLLAGRKHLAINFMPEGRGYHKKIVAQGWPGDTPAEKMKNFGFTLEDGLCIQEDPTTPRPKVVSEAYQVMECTWMSDLENAEEDIGRVLEDGAFGGQVALEDGNAAFGSDGSVERLNNVFPGDMDPVLFVGLLQPSAAVFVKTARLELVQVLILWPEVLEVLVGREGIQIGEHSVTLHMTRV